jgi:hypothetical protein
MGIWANAGTPRYEQDSAGIAYISNVGAYHQTLVRSSLARPRDFPILILGVLTPSPFALIPPPAAVHLHLRHHRLLRAFPPFLGPSLQPVLSSAADDACLPAAAQYIASLLAERWLRHVDRIPAHGIRNRRVVIYDLFAILFCCIGSAALVVLSAFNCYS